MMQAGDTVTQLFTKIKFSSSALLLQYVEEMEDATKKVA